MGNMVEMEKNCSPPSPIPKKPPIPSLRSVDSNEKKKKKPSFSIAKLQLSQSIAKFHLFISGFDPISFYILGMYRFFRST